MYILTKYALILPLILAGFCDKAYKPKVEPKILQEYIVDLNQNGFTDEGDYLFRSYDVDGDGDKDAEACHKIRITERGIEYFSDPFLIITDEDGDGKPDRVYFDANCDRIPEFFGDYKNFEEYLDKLGTKPSSI